MDRVGSSCRTSAASWSIVAAAVAAQNQNQSCDAAVESPCPDSATAGGQSPSRPLRNRSGKVTRGGETVSKEAKSLRHRAFKAAISPYCDESHERNRASVKAATTETPLAPHFAEALTIAHGQNASSVRPPGLVRYRAEDLSWKVTGDRRPLGEVDNRCYCDTVWTSAMEVRAGRLETRCPQAGLAVGLA